MSKPANPFEHEMMPDEPEKGTVLAYQITYGPIEKEPREDLGSLRRISGVGRTYDYVSFRAGNGKWYTTGDRCVGSNETWDELWSRLTRRGELSKIKYATAWADLVTDVHTGPPVTGEDWGRTE